MKDAIDSETQRGLRRYYQLFFGPSDVVGMEEAMAKLQTWECYPWICTVMVKMGQDANEALFKSNGDPASLAIPYWNLGEKCQTMIAANWRAWREQS